MSSSANQPPVHNDEENDNDGDEVDVPVPDVLPFPAVPALPDVVEDDEEEEPPVKKSKLQATTDNNNDEGSDNNNSTSDGGDNNNGVDDVDNGNNNSDNNNNDYHTGPLGPTTSIILPLEEFAEDAEKKLNFANGRIYQRKSGVENVHDGQIMVRLKKKRFVILDYGYVPTQQDMEYANNHPHISIPEGAGIKQCTRNHCHKVGVPVMLYDSEPHETPSLYLRTGLCFGCQKKWNEEKRQSYTKKSPMKTKKEKQKALKKKLNEVDAEVNTLVEMEKARQKASLVLIASENYVSRAVLDALGSVLCNKYSEGYPGARYFCGNENIDKLEVLCQKRALDLFGLKEEEWGVNVQSLSGSSANFQVYTALLNPHDRILSLDLPDGGHLSHGYQTIDKKVSMVSRYFETMSYHINKVTGLIDYDEMERNALLFQPKLIIAGASSYSRLINYERIRNIADIVGAYVVADISSVAGLMASEAIPSCFPWVDVVTSSTDTSLRGPRGAMIFYRKGQRIGRNNTPVIYDLEQKINFAVFPGLQGTPHNNTMGAIAVALKQASAPEFAEYQEQVIKNCARLSSELKEMGYEIVSGGSDNHLIVVNVKSSCGIDGARVERIMELACIAANKTSVPGDKSVLTPGGILLGTYAMTTRGAVASDFVRVAEFFNRAVTIAVALSQQDHGEDMKRFQNLCAVGPTVDPDLVQLRREVIEFASLFPTAGFDANDMEIREVYAGDIGGNHHAKEEDEAVSETL